MGRLFWKFFLILVLVQFVTAIGVGLAIWSLHTDRSPELAWSPEGPPHASNLFVHEPRQPPFDQPPPHLPPPLIPLIAGVMVSFLFAWLLAWYFARPIRILRAALESVAEGRLDTRIGVSIGDRNDELVDLAKYFDHMISRLERLIDTQHRLLHDVSHELRSPLARLRAATDLIQQQPDRSAEFVERIHRDTVRMDTLLGELLTLAKLDAGISGNQGSALDVGEIIGEIIDDARLVADQKQCSIIATGLDSIIINGNQELMHRALDNVVRNAIRFAPSGTVVEIDMSDVNGLLRVTVSDCGPGVTEGALNQIFEPFVRIAPSNSSDGYGLGLAISRRIMESLGGIILATNRVPSGLLVTMEFPKDKITQ